MKQADVQAGVVGFAELGLNGPSVQARGVLAQPVTWVAVIFLTAAAALVWLGTR